MVKRSGSSRKVSPRGRTGAVRPPVKPKGKSSQSKSQRVSARKAKSQTLEERRGKPTGGALIRERSAIKAGNAALRKIYGKEIAAASRKDKRERSRKLRKQIRKIEEDGKKAIASIRLKAHKDRLRAHKEKKTRKLKETLASGKAARAANTERFLKKMRLRGNK